MGLKNILALGFLTLVYGITEAQPYYYPGLEGNVFWSNKDGHHNTLIQLSNNSCFLQNPFGSLSYQNSSMTYATQNWGIRTQSQVMNTNGQTYSTNDLGFYVIDKNGNFLGVAVNMDIVNINHNQQSNFGFRVTIGSNPYIVVDPLLLYNTLPDNYIPLFRNYKTLPHYVLPIPNPH